MAQSKPEPGPAQKNDRWSPKAWLAVGLAQLWRRLPPSLRWWTLHRSNDRFLIGVLGMVVDSEDRVLLLEHRFRVPWRWGLPGGFVRRGESLEASLRRELMEEIGLEVDVEAEPFDVELTVRSGHLSATFLARPRQLPSELRIQDKAEILDGEFFGPGDIPNGLYPRHAQLIRQFWEQRGRISSG